MRRFWKDVTVVADGGFQISLDGRRVRTPARAELVLPSARLAEAVAEEWRGALPEVDPRAMPLTGLANAAIDRVAPDIERFAAGLAKFGETDLLYYRVDAPEALVELQAAEWDPLLAWARRRYDIDFCTIASTIYRSQPPATVERLAHAVAALDAFRLAGLLPLVTIGGSLVAALAVLEGAVTPEAGWQAVTLDERWQSEQWGADSEAEAALASRRGEFVAAARFVELLD